MLKATRKIYLPLNREEAVKKVVDYFEENKWRCFTHHKILKESEDKILIRGWNVPATLAVNFLLIFKNMNNGCQVTVIAYFTKFITFLLYFPLIFVFGGIFLSDFIYHRFELPIFIETVGLAAVWFGFLTCCLWATLKIYSRSLVKRFLKGLKIDTETAFKDSRNI